MTDDAPPGPKGPPPLPAPPVSVPASAPSSAAPLPPYPPARDLSDTLPGTGVIPLVDGDAVVGVLRDLGVSVQRLSIAMHRRFDAVDGAVAQPAPKSLPARVAGHAWTSAQVLLLVTGAVGFAMQVAAVFKPSLVSPLQHLQQFLKDLGAQ